MNDGLHLSDRMPAVARGQGTWSPEEHRHLAGCADCGAEWRLVRTAIRLGHQVESDLDPGPVGDAVLARLRQGAAPRGLRRRIWRWLPLAAAAAAAIVLISRPWSADSPALPFAQHALLPELDGLDAEQLEAVLELLPAADAPPAAGPPALGDLTEDELERVLRTLEGSS